MLHLRMSETSRKGSFVEGKEKSRFARPLDAFESHKILLLWNLKMFWLVKTIPGIVLRVHKNHLKMVKGCSIDTGPCKKVLT